MLDISVAHLFKRYGDTVVLADFSHVFSPGVTCLMGASGQGKTTLLRLLLGLEKPDSGTICGLTGKRLSAVFQENRLLNWASAKENLRFALGADYDQDAAKQLFSQLGLDPENSQPLSSYSGGMKRRLALARALLLPFDALFLDEPFTGLDEETRARSAACLLGRSAGCLVIMATHSETEAALLQGKILRL